MSLPRPGWAEMDAEADWWGDAADVIAELVAGVDPDVIAGVCVSGLGPCLLVADADAGRCAPAILYGIDMRATAEIAELTARYGEEAIRTRCGKALSTPGRRPQARCGCAATSPTCGRARGGGTRAAPSSWHG